MSELSKTIRNHPLVVNSELTEVAKDELAKELANEEYLEFKKPNIISQKGKFNFNAVQQDLLNFMFWKFDEVNFEDKTLTLKCEEIIKLFGLKRGGRTNVWIKEVFLDIRNKAIFIPVNDPDIQEETFSYFDKIKIKRGSGDVVLEFNPKTLDFLILGATKYFTLYNFFDIFKLKGKYAKRIYELLSSFLYKTNQYTTTLEKLKELLHYSYEFQSDVERKIIIPALQEINDNTCLNVEYKIDENKITFIYSPQNILKDNIILNEKYQKLYEKVKQKEEAERGIIDRNNKNVSYFRHIYEKNEEENKEVVNEEIKRRALELINEDTEWVKAERDRLQKVIDEQELRKKIEAELREKIRAEMQEEQSLLSQMEKEKKDMEEIQEICRLLEEHHVKKEEWRDKTWAELKTMIKRFK